jgi:hypothetical protein
MVRSLWGITPRCDDKGNLYYRPVQSLGSGPIVRISADGQKVSNIDLSSVPDFGGNRGILAWTTGLRGEIYLLAVNKDRDRRFLTFDEDGVFKSAEKLDSEFVFFHLAVFPTDEILATGVKEHEGLNEVSGEPYTAIFDRNGKLLKEISFSGDVKGYPVTEHNESASQSWRAVGLGDEVPADDGNIYLMRKTDKNLLRVISPAGEVVRKLTLVPPHEGWDGYRYLVAGGKIVMEFMKPEAQERNSSTVLYSLYDAESGERQIDYEVTPEIIGPFACYTSNQFTFLTLQDSALSIIHAVPK